MKVVLIVGIGYLLYSIGKMKFRHYCDGTVGDSYCNNMSFLFGPYYSTGGQLLMKS